VTALSYLVPETMLDPLRSTSPLITVLQEKVPWRGADKGLYKETGCLLVALGYLTWSNLASLKDEQRGK
jgi:hypothetical protein